MKGYRHGASHKSVRSLVGQVTQHKGTGLSHGLEVEHQNHFRKDDKRFYWDNSRELVSHNILFDIFVTEK